MPRYVRQDNMWHTDGCTCRANWSPSQLLYLTQPYGGDQQAFSILRVDEVNWTAIEQQPGWTWCRIEEVRLN